MVNSDPRNTIELITEFTGAKRPDFRFHYPLPIFSDSQVPMEGLDITNLQSRNSFLKYAEPTDVDTVKQRSQALEGLQDVVRQYFPGITIITISLMGSYVNPWNLGKGNDIDVNVIYRGEGFHRIEIPIRGIQQRFPDIPGCIEELEVVAIGDENAIHGTKTKDSFISTTGRDNVVPITVAGLWNRDIPVFGTDYRQIPDNEINLLKLAYDLIESATRRYLNRGLNKQEPEDVRMRKALCRVHEAGAYLEELYDGLRLGSSRISLLQDGLTTDELKLYVDGILGKTIERYLHLERIIK